MAEEKDKDKGGRPTDYKASYNKTAYKLCLLGFTDKELAEHFDVAESTINEWKKKYPAFKRELNKGKKLADANVAEGLYKRATGYKWQEVTYEKVLDEETMYATPDTVVMADAYKKKIVTKELPPDPGACISWLKNRQRDKWVDKIDISTQNITYTAALDPEEARAISKMLDEKY